MNSQQDKETAADKPDAQAPLPRGRHLLSPEEVESHQRERILNAVARRMAADGYAALTVGQVIAEARVSRTTFYAQFSNKLEAVLGTHEQIFRSFLAGLEDACAEEEEWRMKVKRAVETAVDFAVARPEQAALLTGQGELVDQRIGETMVAARQQLAGLLQRGRRYPSTRQLPPITEEALVGAICAVLSRALRDGGIEEVDDLRSHLVAFTLVFY